MYRNLLVACLLLLCAALLVACSDPVRIARREVDRITKVTQTTQVSLKRETRAVMLQTAKEEGQRRGTELQAAGCGPANATQPSSALVDPCKGIVAASEKRYGERQNKIAAVAKRVDAGAIATYAAIVVVLDIIEDVMAGQKASGWEAKLAAVVAGAVKSYADVLVAYQAFKEVIAPTPTPASAPAKVGGVK